MQGCQTIGVGLQDTCAELNMTSRLEEIVLNPENTRHPSHLRMLVPSSPLPRCAAITSDATLATYGSDGHRRVPLRVLLPPLVDTYRFIGFRGLGLRRA